MSINVSLFYQTDKYINILKMTKSFILFSICIGIAIAQNLQAQQDRVGTQDVNTGQPLTALGSTDKKQQEIKLTQNGNSKLSLPSQQKKPEIQTTSPVIKKQSITLSNNNQSMQKPKQINSIPFTSKPKSKVKGKGKNKSKSKAKAKVKSKTQVNQQTGLISQPQPQVPVKQPAISQPQPNIQFPQPQNQPPSLTQSELAPKTSNTEIPTPRPNLLLQQQQQQQKQRQHQQQQQLQQSVAQLNPSQSKLQSQSQQTQAQPQPQAQPQQPQSQSQSQQSQSQQPQSQQPQTQQPQPQPQPQKSQPQQSQPQQKGPKVLQPPQIAQPQQPQVQPQSQPQKSVHQSQQTTKAAKTSTTNPIPQNQNEAEIKQLPKPHPLQPAAQTQQSSSAPIYCGTQAYMRRSVGTFKQNPFLNKEQREKLVSTNYGFDMYVDSKDYSVSNIISNSGTWQPHYINLIGHIVKKGDSVLNLGSQSGLEALVMGKIIGPTGKLFIFEPYTFSHQLVKMNIEMNGLNDITTIYKVGASDEKSTGDIQVFYSNTGGSEITLASQIPQGGAIVNPMVGEKERVEVNRVDSLLPADVKLDFALIDVQKMEVKALKGMKEVIDRSPNLVLMVEWQYASNRFGNREQTKQLIDYFQQKGYKIYMYSGGDIVRCKVGQFFEIKDINSLYQLNLVDLFFFPSTVPLPQ